MAVFISYRREDSEGDARALYNRLAQETDQANLFLDFEAIGAGDDWKSRIDQNLDKVKAFLVVIGPRWLEILKSRSSSETNDEVRREIAAALAKPRLRVLPILVKGATMPAAEQLPAPSVSRMRSRFAARRGRGMSVGSLGRYAGPVRCRHRSEHGFCAGRPLRGSRCSPVPSTRRAWKSPMYQRT